MNYILEINSDEDVSLKSLINLALNSKGIEALPAANHWLSKISQAQAQEAAKALPKATTDTTSAAT